MSSLFKLARDLSRIPWSLRSAVERDEKSWFAHNVHRRRLAHSKLEREILFAAEHPLRFVISLVALQITLLLLIFRLPPDWFVPTWLEWETADQLAHFATVWTIQATLAALVYPIVISFVAVYLQRRPAAEAFIHLYMLDSGAIAAGLSSLTLVVIMGVQYLMLGTWGTEWLPGWAAIDTAWFILNAALTTFFLFRTVEFLRPEVQKRVIQRYSINVALPRDVKRLYAYFVLIEGIDKGWLPIPAYGDKTTTDGPRLLIGRYDLREGVEECTIDLQKQTRLTDVRLWPIRIILENWYQKALASARPGITQPSGSHKTWPLLTLPIHPGKVYDGKVTLARVSDGPKLAIWQRKFLLWSMILTPTFRESYGIRVGAIIDELAADARSLAAKSDNEGFERSYKALVDLHKLLIAACLDKTHDGEKSSWALLPDTDHAFRRPLHETWSEAYRGLFQAAIESMARDTSPVRRLCHLLQHLDTEEFRNSPIEIQEQILQLPPLMFYLLGNWWTFRVEEQGILEHSHEQMVMLRPPLNRVYEEVLSTFTGGWENGRPDGLSRDSTTKKVEWSALPELSRLSVKHIEESARMLLSAIQRGDQAASEWLADVLNKWWSILDLNQEPFQLYDKTSFITIDDLEIEWSDFCKKFGLENADEETPDHLKISLQIGAFKAAIRNYWSDIRILSIELMLDWIRTTKTTTVSNSLSFEIATGLLIGKQWRSGSRVVGSLSDLLPSDYLIAKVRQFAAYGKKRGTYEGRLDRFVERVKDMRRPNMISSRAYSYSGADDVESLQDSQIELLIVLTNSEWGMPRSLQRQLDMWFDPILEQYSSIDRVRNRLKDFLDQLNTRSISSIDNIELIKNRVRPGLSSQSSLEFVKDGLLSIQKFLEDRRAKTLASQPIDPDRLSEIGRFASSTGFDQSTGHFPTHLFPIKSSQNNLEDFTLTFTKFHRGELTKIQMEPRASNEEEYFSEALAQQVASVVLNDLIHRSDIKVITAHDAESYWDALKVEAQQVMSRGGTPILVLENATRPSWVWDWQHADFGADYKRPEDLQVSRRKNRGSGYICDFNNIAVYIAPIPTGQSILFSREAFHALSFTDYGNHQFVKVDAVENEENKNLVDLRISFSRKVETGNSQAARLVYT